MVAFGDIQQPPPFAIDCALAGKGRWLDDRHWVYDLEEEPQAGYCCTFTLRPDIVTLSGRQVEGDRLFTFDTGGPPIMAYLPSASDIEEDQMFVLLPGGPVKHETLEGRIFFEIDGVGEKVEAVIVKGAERDSFLTALRATLGIEEYWQFNREYPRYVRKAVTLRSDKIQRQLLVIKCRRPFPPGRRIELVWDADPVLPLAIRNVEANVLTKLLTPTGQDSPPSLPGMPARQEIVQDDQTIISWLQRLESHSSYAYETSIFENVTAAQSFTVPNPGGESAFELVGIPLPEPGLHIVEIASPKLGEVLFAQPGTTVSIPMHSAFFRIFIAATKCISWPKGSTGVTTGMTTIP